MSFADELEDALVDIRAEFDAGATYYRGAIAFDLGAVSKGATNFRFVGDDGGTQFIQSTDWLVSAAAITNGEMPRVGDRITEIIGSDQHNYEVASINGEPCWAWSDAKKTQLRIHTQFTGKAAV